LACVTILRQELQVSLRQAFLIEWFEGRIG
jgi:hypothetical protein